MSVLNDPDAFLHETGRLTLVVGGIAAAAGSLVWDWHLGLGIALGALLAHVNLMLIARTLSDALGRVTAAQPGTTDAPAGTSSEGLGTPRGTVDADDSSPDARAKRESARVRAQGLFRLPLVVLAMVLILWYMPARPEGVALGVVLSLASAVLAALRGENRRSAPPETPEDPPA